MKLTPRQNCVIWCMQNDWIAIVHPDAKGVSICGYKLQYEITYALFMRLVDNGLIYQQLSPPYEWVLTKIGENIKTKPITF